MLATAAALLAGLGFWQRQQSARGRDVAPYTVLARSGELPGVVTAAGELDAVERVNVSPKRQGLIEQLFVDEGDAVKAGQALARVAQLFGSPAPLAQHLQIVVNHCATPVDRDEAGLDRWRKGLALMAAQPNVAIKVSNFGAYAPDKSPEGLRTAVLTCIDAFGPDRSMFGTDYPVGRRALSYADNVTGFAHAIAGFSEAEQRALFHDNATRIYQF